MKFFPFFVLCVRSPDEDTISFTRTLRSRWSAFSPQHKHIDMRKWRKIFSIPLRCFSFGIEINQTTQAILMGERECCGAVEWDLDRKLKFFNLDMTINCVKIVRELLAGSNFLSHQYSLSIGSISYCSHSSIKTCTVECARGSRDSLECWPTLLGRRLVWVENM